MRTAALFVCLVLFGTLAFGSVVLSHFEFSAGDGHVGFTWGTTSETDNYFFMILRNGQVVQQVPGHNTTTLPQEYDWTDTAAPNGAHCRYHLLCYSSTDHDTLRAFTAIPPHFAAIDTFTVHGNASRTQLNWTILSEYHTLRYEVIRNGALVFAVAGHVTSLAPRYYSAVDSTVSMGQSYLYTLWAVGTDSSRDSLSSENITLDAPLRPSDLAPASLELSAYPNPFNATAVLAFTLPAPQRVHLALYDITGHECTRLADEPLSTGEHRVRVDASALPSGVYLARLSGNRQSATQKLLLLK
jgi:hypothetical protein